jgi:hypothetical protein
VFLSSQVLPWLWHFIFIFLWCFWALSLFRQWLCHFFWRWLWHTSLVEGPQANLSNLMYNDKKYYVCFCIYCLFRVLFQFVREDTWRSAAAPSARECGDADLHQGTN